MTMSASAADMEKKEANEDGPFLLEEDKEKANDADDRQVEVLENSDQHVVGEEKQQKVDDEEDDDAEMNETAAEEDAVEDGAENQEGEESAPKTEAKEEEEGEVVEELFDEEDSIKAAESVEDDEKGSEEEESLVEKDPIVDMGASKEAASVDTTMDGFMDKKEFGTATISSPPNHSSTEVSGWTQVRALMHKNALTKIRTPGATLAELASPVLLIMVLWISYNLSDIVSFPARFNHALQLDLPFFWDTGNLDEEDGLDGFDLSDTHRRARRKLQANIQSLDNTEREGVDFGLKDITQKKETMSWGRLFHELNMEYGIGSPEEDLDLLTDFMLHHHIRRGLKMQDFDDDMMESSLFTEDEDFMDLDEEEADSGDWYEEIMTDIRKETIDKVDWDEVQKELKDNFGDMWDDAKGYIRINRRSTAQQMLETLRLRLKGVLRGPMVVPTFGQYVWANTMLNSFVNIRRAFPRLLKQSSYFRQWGNLLTLGTIHLSPAGHPMTSKFLAYLERTYPAATRLVVFRTHTDHDSAMDYVMNHVDDERTWAVIDLEDLKDPALTDGDSAEEIEQGGSYTIRLNYTTIPNTNLVENYVASGLSTKYQRYYLSGYLTLQRAVNDFVIDESGCGGHNDVDPFFSMPMPTAAYQQNIFFLHVGYLLGLSLVMALLYPTSRLIQGLVEERETRMKETLLILGVRPWAHATSWICTSMMTFASITCFMSIVLQKILTHTSFALIWFWMGIFSMASMSFCFFLSAFFDRAKLAAVIGPMALFASLLPRFIFFGTNRYEAISAKYLASILPGTALAFGADIVGDYEYGEQSVADHFWVGDYSFGSSIGFLLFDTVFWMALAWYAEQVMPRQYGAAPKPWYFPFLCCYPTALVSRCFPSDKTLAESDVESDLESSDELSVAPIFKARTSSLENCVEAVTDPALIPRVFIKDLVKRYNNKAPKPAVNNLNLNLYESQITALLGHNGAGKTSTVSILTGLFPPTSGDVSIYGHSVVDDLAKARQSIGICPQHDVLFDRLTVMEHLKFFSKIKGVPFNESALKEKAFEMGLTEDQLRTTAAALSGGNKRKLSVAISLCGDPKFLILDEPTSAMDPTARRRCWQVLRRKREGRVTLLTTHFMDEAEHLSDRVAVVSQGELQCCGSPLYLKNRYNLGWNLTVVMEKPEETNGPETEYAACQRRVTNFLKKFVPDTELVRRSGRELTFCFPKGSEHLFPEAFDAFETQSHALGVASYGVENASFEEVFLLLAETGERQGERAAEDSHSVAETGSIVTENDYSRTMSDNESVASSKFTADSGSTRSDSEIDSDSESAMAVDPNINPLGFKESTNYQSMSAIRQIGLLYWKRFTVQKRDKKTAFFAIVVPVVLIALVVLVLTFNVVIAGPPREMSPVIYKGSYSSSSSGEASTQVLIGGGASAKDGTFVQSEYLSLDSGMESEYPNAQVTRLGHVMSSSELSHYLLDTYNDHDHPTRFGAFSFDDAVQLNVNVNFTAFKDQIDYYSQRRAFGSLNLRAQRVDLLELFGFSGRSGRVYWRKSVAGLASDFYAWTGLTPDVKVRTEDLFNITQAALQGIMASSNNDLAEVRAKYALDIRSLADDIYNMTMIFLESGQLKDVEVNISSLASNYVTEAENMLQNEDQIIPELEVAIKNLVEKAFEKEDLDESGAKNKFSVYRWQGNVEILVRSFLTDLSTIGENPATNSPSIYNLTQTLAADVTDLANSVLNNITQSNYTVESIEEEIIKVFNDGNNDFIFKRDVVLREVSQMFNRIASVYGLGEHDSTELVQSVVEWIDARLLDYSDGSITRIPSKAFVAPLVLVDFVLGKWSVETISPQEAFEYLSESLGGSPSQLSGFISIRAKDAIVDFGKLAIDLDDIYITTGKGIVFQLDREIPLSFSIDALQKLAPSDSMMQFQFDVHSKTSLLHNSSSPHAVAVFNQAYMENRYKQCLGTNTNIGNAVNARLVSVNHPLPITNRQSLEIKVMLSVLAALFILIPFCYIPATFVVFLVRERVSKSKHLQLVSGVNMSSYWCSAYLWDLSLYLFLTFCVILVFLMYGENAEVFIGDKDSFLATFSLIFGYGVSSLPFSYLLSRWFENSSTAQISIAGIGWLTGFVLIIAYVTMDAIEKTKDAAATLQPFFRLFPAYNLGEGLMAMCTSFWYREILGWDQHPLDWEIAGQNICYIYALAPPYFFLALVLEYADDGGAGGLLGRGLRLIYYSWSRMLLWWHGIRVSSSDDTDGIQYSLLGDDDWRPPLDDDVAAEREYVLTNKDELRQTAPVVLVNLWKIYPPSVGVVGAFGRRLRNTVMSMIYLVSRTTPVHDNEEEKAFVPKQAVRGVTTAIKKGETYALLGANGAGKTTTMALLSGDVTSTNGSAFIAGHNATGGSNNGVTEARRNIGFCPQKDPLLDLMTGRETLTMFARLRGVPPKEVDSLVQELLDRLTLTPHADKVTKAYSGGNKRKLSLGMALIGDPKVLLIDESSSGLDPLAKRRMWDLIEEAARSRSVILTTHSMQEAEALCTRVAIMVKGEYVCLGSVQHLKTKYLDGYTVDVFCKATASDAVVDDVETAVMQALPNCKVAERYGRFMRFEVSNVSTLGLGTCFRRLQEVKNNPRFHVENYSVSQCSLEHVFVKLVNQKKEENIEKVNIDV